MSLLVLFRPRYGEVVPGVPLGPWVYWSPAEYAKHQRKLQKRYALKKKKRQPETKKTTQLEREVKKVELTYSELQTIAQAVAEKAVAPVEISFLRRELKSILDKLTALEIQREQQELMLAEQQLMEDLAILAEYQRRIKLIRMQSEMLLMLLMADDD